ncbi:hypothetical protein A3J98_01010 [candidate division WS6 bacterium RIFOXYC1_FULL_33_10]|uniref:DZANK-type domain-containing protein n=1 Tax=candidate division WS6 bacterium RIFOXYC1_FULL_33_10 TaxID=1802606 RepID=A0A1F4UN81_9BACT|nr:MAG: hypothetical protein A3J98_01010 [candidate division WS6 bacterium RIFOXYC1_FULL_33_10]
MGLEKFILSIFEFAGGINFNLFSLILGVIILLFWLVIIGWVWIDSGERTSKTSIRVVYLLLVIFLNIPGLIIYLIVRPSETIEQIYWADLERRYLKYETAELGDCSKCGSQLLPGYVHCSNCGNEIKRRCPKCGVLINKDHKFCENCGTQLRERAIAEEQYPNVVVMEQQILATKEHATQTVESKRTRYKTGKSFVVKLGDVIISGLKKIKESIPSRIVIEEKNQESIAPKEVVQTTEKKKKKSKKKKKR